MLDEAAALASALEHARPEVEIAFLENLADGYRNLRLPAKARPLRQRIVAILETRPDRDEQAYATALHNAGRYEEALAIREQCLQAPHVDLASSLYSLGARADREGRLPEAQSLLSEARLMMEAILPVTHRQALAYRRRQAEILHRMGANEEALALLDEALQALAEADTVTPLAEGEILMMRGWLHQDMGHYARAEADLRSALKLYRGTLPRGHPSLTATHSNLGLLLKDVGKFEEAEEHLTRSLALNHEAGKTSLMETRSNHYDLSRLYADWGQWERALPLARQALAGALDHAVPDRLVVSKVQTTVGRILVRLGCAEEALPYLEESFSTQQEQMPPDQWERHKTASVLGAAYSQLGRFEEAEELLGPSAARIAELRPADHYRTAQAWHRLVEHYERRGDADRTAECRARITPRMREHRIVRETVP